ncbi:hypothetical protein [Azospirillum doebereinerae]|uniref:DUF2946 domain-containing protein n=1 Tax=Azospirillum doebereinerae TaxID=92933 RepID=A0A3S0WNN4_9PROT|nr:hypothetical protein [Azospirillum doebereinerae]RUQ74279.1 hypothetical protein EJ913_08005 [Azospirillum doebereinerae]
MATLGPKRLNAGAALVAVAVLLVHALAMGWHVPPQLRALAALDGSVCHGATTPGSESPDHPSSPSDHLAHCPLCLSADGGTLFGPAAGPSVTPPGRFVRIAFAPGEAMVPAGGAHDAFLARGPPAAV